MTKIFNYPKIVCIFSTENVAIPVEVILSPDKGMEFVQKIYD